MLAALLERAMHIIDMHYGLVEIDLCVLSNTQNTFLQCLIKSRDLLLKRSDPLIHGH